MKYFKITTEGNHDWGGDPTYWLEVNAAGDAVRQIEEYPNGNILGYDKTHSDDKYGALSVMVVDDDAEWWAPYEITKEQFENEWDTVSPLNR